jgi:hypothetical protein
MEQVTLYDIQGRLLQNYEVKDVPEYKCAAPTQNQVILLKITTVEDKIVFKKMLN